MLGAEKINQGPGLSVQIALISMTETGVADQALEPQRVSAAAASRGAASRGRG